MGERVLDRLPLVYVILAPLAGLGAYFLSQTSSWGLITLLLYLNYAAAETVITISYAVIAQSGKDGKVAVWLVSVLYAGIFFVVTLWSIEILLGVRYLHPELVTDSGRPQEGAQLIESLSYAFIAASAAAANVSAAVLLYGFRHGGLQRKIRPWPWPPRKIIKGE